MKKINCLIVGLGLIGGSFALGLRKIFPDSKIYGYDLKKKSIEIALKKKIIDRRFNFDSKNPVSDSVGNALIANNHKQARRSVMEDFIVGGIKCVESGEIARNSDDIMEWLVKKAKVELRFSNDSGIWTKIVNQIIERTSEDKALVLIKEREDWLPWVNGIKGINSKQVLLYKAGTGTNASRFWTDHVLPNLGNPKPTILYTTSYSPAKCSEDVKRFKEALEEFHVQTYGLVNNGISSAMGLLTLNAPETLPCKFLGVIPNLKKNGQPTLYDNNQLVSVDDYINDGSLLSKKLKIVS